MVMGGGIRQNSDTELKLELDSTGSMVKDEYCMGYETKKDKHQAVIMGISSPEMH